MKIIICLALCLLAVSAVSPIDKLSDALELLDMQNLFDDYKAFDLSSSFTFLGGAKGDDNKVSEQIWINGTYNLLTYEDGKSELKTGSFNKAKKFSSHEVVNFTGSGAFNARAGGYDFKGYFNGGSSTDFAFEGHKGYGFGFRKHSFSGEFNGKNQSWGEGHIEVDTWQHGDKSDKSSNNKINYGFGGDNDGQQYQGQSKGYAKALSGDSVKYRAIFSSVFHGNSTKDSWDVRGGYVLDVYDSDWKNVWSKDGPFAKNGSCDEAMGTLSHLKALGFSKDSLITE